MLQRELLGREAPSRQNLDRARVGTKDVINHCGFEKAGRQRGCNEGSCEDREISAMVPTKRHFL
jgi:hypothetical protein